MTSPVDDPVGVPGGIPRRIRKAERWQLIALAVIGVVLAIIAITWTQPTLVVAGIIFGIYLIFAGIYRVSGAIVREGMSTGIRWLWGILGLIILAAGVFLIANPFGSIIVLAYVVGIGWILEGVIDITAGAQSVVSPRWLAFVSGAISILAGLVMFILPVLGLAVFIVVVAFLLIAVSVSTLLTLPRDRTNRGRTVSGSRP